MVIYRVYTVLTCSKIINTDIKAIFCKTKGYASTSEILLVFQLKTYGIRGTYMPLPAPVTIAVRLP